jgi:hypothetical protein
MHDVLSGLVCDSTYTWNERLYVWVDFCQDNLCFHSKDRSEIRPSLHLILIFVLNKHKLIHYLLPINKSRFVKYELENSYAEFQETVSLKLIAITQHTNQKSRRIR